MTDLFILARQLLADRRGGAFGYSSLMLLGAIAAVALIAQVADPPN
ncbi:MAG: hypothetical protein KIT25_07150 [Enhydrobacter sp.]|nr:MAG: hypothetical protein KIT25_07150 [Enhydrobacter sp.]